MNIKNSLASCTVCIPAYNQGAYIEASIDSALRQSVVVDVMVSDDASTDGTATLLERYVDHTNVAVFRHSQNNGIGGNVHWLLQQPQTQFIARLDSDDVLEPDYVAVLQKLLEEFPLAGYAHCSVREIGSDGATCGVRRLRRKHTYESPDLSLHNLVSGYRVAANIIMFRREALNNVGFGNPTLNFAEDYDLCIRLAEAGWGNAYTPQILANYRVWHGVTRPRVSRKLQEIQGLEGVATRLQNAYMDRGWSKRRVPLRRIQLAFIQSDILDSESLTSDERVALSTALVNLSGIANSSFRRVFGASWMSHVIRRAIRSLCSWRKTLKFLTTRLRVK